MKTIFKVFVLAAISLSFMACTHKGLDYRHSSKTSLQVTAGLGTATKAYDATWEGTDVIGITASGDDDMAAAYQNAEYTIATYSANYATFSSVTTPVDNTIYFTAPGPVYFTAYGPYSGDGDPATLPGDDEDGVLSPSTASQSTLADQSKIDFIFAEDGDGVYETDPTVYFKFYHKMAKIVINVTYGEGLSSTLASIQSAAYTLKGLIQTGSFTVTSGTAEAEETDPTDWKISDYWVKTTYYDIDNETELGVTFTGIIYPQKPDSTLETSDTGAFIFSADDLGLTTDRDSNALAIPEGGFTAGNAYTYTITVNEHKLTVGSSADGTNGNVLNDWTTQTGGSGTIG